MMGARRAVAMLGLLCGMLGIARADGSARTASIEFGGDRIAVEARQDGALAGLDVVQYRGTARRVLDAHEWEGGPPELVDLFAYPVSGIDHVFVIVAWNVHHAGLGTRGRLYEVGAYHDDGTGWLRASEWVARQPGIRCGFVGVSESVASDFEGTDREGVIRLLEREAGASR